MALDDLPADDIDTPREEPNESRAWLAEIDKAEHVFRSYNERQDNIDKQYADLNRLAG